MDGFFELFQPGYKHLREERDRKRLEAQIPETGAPPFGIDLESGVARISIPAPHQVDGVQDDTPAPAHDGDD